MTKAEEVRMMILEPLVKEGITLAELARRTGCLPRTIQYWSTGRMSPSLNQADKALKALGLSMTIGVDKE